MDGCNEFILAAEGVDQLHRGAEFGQRRDAQHADVIQVEHPLVGVFDKQGVEHGAGLFPIFIEHGALFDVRGTLTAGQRLGVKGDVADEIEGVEVSAKLLGDAVERKTLVLQFFDNRLFAFLPPSSAEGNRRGWRSVFSGLSW